MGALPQDFPPLRTRFAGTEAPVPGVPPFKGLQYFEEADSELFFGRELLTAKLVDRLRQTQFLSVIIGASGSGKSSLVRAGLIPALKKGGPFQWAPGRRRAARLADLYDHADRPSARSTGHRADSQLGIGHSRGDPDGRHLQDPRSLFLYLTRLHPKGHALLVLDSSKSCSRSAGMSSSAKPSSTTC